MDKNLKVAIHRYALWKAYNGKCFYCGGFIQTVYDLEEEHIIPQKYKDKPTEIEKIIKEYNLWEDFDIDAYYNRIPTHSGCNIRKGFKLYRKETIQNFLNLAEGKAKKIQEIEERTEKKALVNDELFKKGLDRGAIEKFLKIIEEDQTKQKNNEENLTSLNFNRERLHRDQEKWQEFYNRMLDTDIKHLGIDIQNLLNRKIHESDFEEVLKMNIGSRGKYYKIYNNQEWFFSFLNNRMSGNHYEIFVRDEITQQTYNFFKPTENKDILKRWLDYVVKYCLDTEIMIIEKNIVNERFEEFVNIIEAKRKVLKNLESKHLEATIYEPIMLDTKERYIAIKAVNKGVRPIVITAYGIRSVKYDTFINTYLKKLVRRNLCDPLPKTLSDGEACQALYPRKYIESNLKDINWEYPLEFKAYFNTNDGIFYSNSVELIDLSKYNI